MPQKESDKAYMGGGGEGDRKKGREKWGGPVKSGME